MSKLTPYAIIETIFYADIFDYPLTKEEVSKYLIKIKIINPMIVDDWLKKSELIKEKDGYYFLEGREKIVNLRKRRREYSQEKLKICDKVISVIKIIPSVKLIGITGALAVDNTKKDDDIDLFIITSENLLWTTRLLVTILVEFIGIRRHPSDKYVNNKICLNMFVDEGYLEIPKHEQDLFSAHEIIQMKPLLDRDDTYQRFLQANNWVKMYLPNAWLEVIKKIEIKKVRSSSNLFPNYLIPQLLNYFEILIMKFQLWYMRNRLTSEVINKGFVRFHPKDAREWVMREHKKKTQIINC